jgi:RNA polymerase sigma factor (sigma-70 family)
MKTNLSDQVEDAKQDPQAFAQIYDIFYRQIFNYLLRKTQNFDIAKDLTADTLFNAIRKIRDFKYKNDESFVAWLYRIAGNCFNEYFRKQNKYKFCLPEELEGFYRQEIPQNEIETIEHEITANDDFKLVATALKKLDSKSQNLIELRYWEELSFEQISEITGVRAGTLKVQAHRAIEQLRTILN